MAGEVPPRVIELLGRFGSDLTMCVDRSFPRERSENEQLLALVHIVTAEAPTTREIADVSGLGRRAVTRLLDRLRREDLVTVDRSASDARVFRVMLTPLGHQHARALIQDVDDLFSSASELAQEVVDLLTDGDDEPDPPPAGTLQLLRDIATTGVTIVRDTHARAGHLYVSGRQRSALAQITAADGIRVAQLTPSLGTTSAGASYIVDQLCALGLVVRERGHVPGDARAVTLRATREGKAAGAHISGAIDDSRADLVRLFHRIALEGRASMTPEAPEPVEHTDSNTRERHSA